MNNKNLSNLYWFCQVVECGGFSSASQQSQITPQKTSVSTPTLSRAVSALEDSIGEKLLHRSAKHFKLTATGEQYYQQFSPLFEQITGQWHDNNVQQTVELSGDIHVSCTVPFAEYFLQRHALAFMQRHSKVNIIVHFSHDTSDFIDEQIDLAVVNFAPQQNHLVQRRLFSVPLLLASSQAYLDKFGYPQTVSELLNHQLLSGNSSAKFWQLEENGKVYKIPIKPRYQINNFNLINQAMVAGLGICLMPTPFFQQTQKALESQQPQHSEPLKQSQQSPKVVQILPNVTCQINHTYVVWCDRQLISKRVVAFRDVLFAEVGETEKFLSEMEDGD